MPGRDQIMNAAAIRASLQQRPDALSLRPRDCAAWLGVSEAALVAATCGPAGDGTATRLAAEPAEIVRRLPSLGQVMALTRNQAAVHEKVGTYGQLEGEGAVVGIYGDAIDLRLFLRHWRFAFALDAPGRDGALPRRSLQFFDGRGDAVHKVHLRLESNCAAFAIMVAELANDGWQDDLALEPPAAQPVPRRPPQDVAGLRQAWRELGNVHDFHRLLRRFELDRLTALGAVGSDFAYPVSARAHRQLMTEVADASLGIMVFVGNPGCVQIHSGPIRQLKAAGGWWNVLDPGFNLHLHEAEIGSAWVVTKPTEHGPITSFELFDRAGELTLTLFGERARGQAENPAWRARLAALAPLAEPS
jgi:putative hemin transport protein